MKAGKLVDVTPEFCGKLLSAGSEDYDRWAEVLTPENLKKLRSAKELGPKADFDLDDVVSALLSRAQQEVLCHRYDQAMADLNLWPEASRDEMKEEFAASVKEYSTSVCGAAGRHETGEVVGAFTRPDSRGRLSLHEYSHFPASSFFTSSLTTFPSTRIPAAANLAMAFFITVPMSFIVGEPISAIVVLTPAAISAALAAFGK